MIRSLESYLSHARWVNPLDAMHMANCKPHQLRLAQEVGLTVPKTAITNNPAAVEKLFDDADNGRVIFKTLNRLFIDPDTMVYTTEIRNEFPSASRDRITRCPAIYQELVERKSDLRITVVGSKVFAVRIASQKFKDEEDRLDWRRNQDDAGLLTVAEVKIIFLKKNAQHALFVEWCDSFWDLPKVQVGTQLSCGSRIACFETWCAFLKSDKNNSAPQRHLSK